MRDAIVIGVTLTVTLKIGGLVITKLTKYTSITLRNQKKVGGDGVTRTLYQLEDSLNGKAGTFEWIVAPNPKFGVTHRFFVKK